MSVDELNTLSEYNTVIADNLRVAIDFSAEWCGPCKMISPKFEKLASEFSSIKFVKIDVDKNPEASEKCVISAMPTFHFYLNGVKVAEVVGADEGKLKVELEKLSESK